MLDACGVIATVVGLFGFVMLGTTASAADPGQLFDVIPPEKAAFNYPPPPQEGRKDFFSIAGDGRARCVIRCDAESQEAADLLKTYLDLATGADIPIVEESAPVPEGMGVIHVGDTEVGLKTDLALPDARYGDDAITNINGFLVKTPDAQTLVIRGRTAGGTMMGVVGFLKRYAGIRHYWEGYAGSIGDVIPKSPALRIPEVEWRDWPFFVSRSMSGINEYGPTPPPGGKNVSSMDFLQLDLTLLFGESYFRWLPSDKYGQDHPEYYPLHEDGRRHVPETPTAQGWQPCVSNPEVVRIMADALINYFREHPEAIGINLSVNDGAGDCMCEKCRAMDAPGADYANRIGLSDRYMKFNSQVCDIVAKKFPQKIIAFIAYGSTKHPPTTVKLHPKLMPVLCITGGLNAFDQWDRWMEAGAKRMGIYLYHYDQDRMIMPKMDVRQSAKRIRYMVASGTGRLFHHGMHPLWPITAPVCLVEAELAWDPRRDVDALLDEFYAKFFGPAAGSMKGFYEALESGYERWLQTYGVPHWHGNDSSGSVPAYSWRHFAVLNPAEAERAAACLKQAVAEAEADPLVSQRLEVVRGVFEFVGFGVRQYWAMGRLKAAAVGSEADAENVLADARQVIADARAMAAYKEDVILKPPLTDYAYVRTDGRGRNRNRFLNGIRPGLIDPQITAAIGAGFDAVTDFLREKGDADAAAAWWRARQEAETDPVLVGALAMAEARAKGAQLANLIEDPSFELRGSGKGEAEPGREEYRGVHVGHSRGMPFSWALSPDEAHSGEYSVMLAESYRATVSESIAAKENDRIRASVWVKQNEKRALGGVTGYAVIIGIGGEGGAFASAMIHVPFKPGEWQEVKCDFVAPVGATSVTLRVQATKQERGAKIWVDDMFLGKYPE